MKLSMPTIAYYTSPEALAMIRRVAEFDKIMIELSAITGLSISACADIVRNTCKETSHSWESVAARLKYEALKGGKIRGHGGSKTDS